MNNCNFSGEVIKKFSYQSENETFDFFLAIEMADGEMTQCPFRCQGDMAKQAFSKVQEGKWVECSCRFQRFTDVHTHYFVVTEMKIYTGKPRSDNNSVYLTTKSFLEYYDPTKILERLRYSHGTKEKDEEYTDDMSELP